MIDLFLPLIFGLSMGIEPAESGAPAAPVVAAVDPILPLEQGSGDDLSADREPEPQIPTGKYTTAMEVRPILGMTKATGSVCANSTGRTTSISRI